MTKMRYPGNITIKLFLALIILSSLTFAVYWLWQRQPKGQINPKNDTRISSPSALINQPEKEDIEITSPKNNSTVANSSFPLTGKTAPNSFIIIFSNSANRITTSDENGNFEVEIEIGNKLNLIDVEVLTNTLDPKFKKTLTYYLDQNQPNSVVYTGEVKTTFDTVITISSYGKEIGIRTNNQTKINLPQIEDSPQEQGIKGIRIGDFAQVTGSQNKDVVTANSIVIIRENKPQNSRQFTTVKLITNARSGFFSSKDEKDQIFEFTLAKNSKIYQNKEEAKEADIQKEKSAIIIFHEQSGKKIADLVYLIPQQ